MVTIAQISCHHEKDPPKTECAAAYMVGSLKMVAHAILSPYRLHLYTFMYWWCVHIRGDPQSV